MKRTYVQLLRKPQRNYSEQAKYAFTSEIRIFQTNYSEIRVCVCVFKSISKLIQAFIIRLTMGITHGINNDMTMGITHGINNDMLGKLNDKR